MVQMFPEVNKVSDVAMNILKKRYFAKGETTWTEVADRVVDDVLIGEPKYIVDTLREMIRNRYFIPNSPCLVNSGKKNSGKLACFVVGFPDTIEGIYQTKLDFALIAKKGGGCGTTLTFIRPENEKVEGSTHGYAGGPIKFADTISHDMDAMTQSGFRSMAIMFTMSVYHKDIIKFITAKEEEGKIANANISVVVDDKFMEKVKNNETYQTYFDYPSGRVYYDTYNARDIFNMIVEGAWRNGEPGLLFYDTMNNNSPYKYAGVKIYATNPCGEQILPENGSCNLGSLDIAKFVDENNEIDYHKLEIATRLATRFLDKVIDRNSFPTKGIEEVSLNCRQIGLGIMGVADYFLKKEIAYGSQESADELEKILKFIYDISENQSILMGEQLGIPEWNKSLPKPRRNITLLSIAPTGSISLLAGCSSSIEPIFSEITIRNDKTGSYQFVNDLSEKPYFRCAVSSNGAKEVTWEEHVRMQASAQKYVDSAVSKTINMPNHAHRETIYNAFMKAWESGCKGITVYRNGSRKVEVLTPKNLRKDKCPSCGEEVIKYDNIKKCSKCDWKMEMV